jgi:ribulose 1,5-bisphosphate synthetase/thiazole synthase
MKKNYLLLSTLLLIANFVSSQSVLNTDVLIVGGGTGGTAAGIQAARLGVNTIIAEPCPWLGGMLSAAGVSATDGNHQLPSGLWNEFREAIYKVYGGPKKVATGWVSNTQFEPHIADSIFKAMAAHEKKLRILYHYTFADVIITNNQVKGAKFINTKSNTSVTIYAKQVIEATELGDVLAAAKVPYNLGMEGESITGENVGVKETNSIIQDLTYAAILKDFGSGTDHTIAKPANYTPDEFDGACKEYNKDSTRKAPNVDARKMLDYAKLPNNKYLLNWPGYGNDIYLDIIELNPQQRELALIKAKEQTLRFTYFIQNQLGYKNLGLATDEFPTTDKLALIPYYRESRRVKGLARFSINHIAKPFDYTYYRTGISVGDYPIDHHHKKNPAAPQHLDFYPVPSFNIPLACLIPQTIDGLVVAEKSISVSNVANGTTRLQPCVLLTGQAAGALAAWAVLLKQQARQVSIRRIQQTLLNNKTCLMPYIDAGINHPQFVAIQKVGATGLLRGKGIPYQWANQTWFYPDSIVDANLFIKHYNEFDSTNIQLSNSFLTIQDVINITYNTGTKLRLKLAGNKMANTTLPAFQKFVQEKWKFWGLKNYQPNRPLLRKELAVLLTNTIDPFLLKDVDYEGKFIDR